jgi:hypothetical protein
MVRSREMLLCSGNRFLTLFKLVLQFGELICILVELLTQAAHLRFLILDHLIFGLQVFRVSLRCQGRLLFVACKRQHKSLAKPEAGSWPAKQIWQRWAIFCCASDQLAARTSWRISIEPVGCGIRREFCLAIGTLRCILLDRIGAIRAKPRATA